MRKFTSCLLPVLLFTRSDAIRDDVFINEEADQGTHILINEEAVQGTRIHGNHSSLPIHEEVPPQQQFSQCTIGLRCGALSWCFPNPRFAGPHRPSTVGICEQTVPVVSIVIPIGFVVGISVWLMVERWHEKKAEPSKLEALQEKMASATGFDTDKCQTVIEHLYGAQ